MIKKKEMNEIAKNLGFIRKAFNTKNNYDNQSCYQYVNDQGYLVFKRDYYKLKIDNFEKILQVVNDKKLAVIIKNCEKLIELEKASRKIETKVILTFNYQSKFIDIEIIYNQVQNKNEVGCVMVSPMISRFLPNYGNYSNYCYETVLYHAERDRQLLKISKNRITTNFKFINDNESYRNQINFENIYKDIFLQELAIFEMLSL